MVGYPDESQESFETRVFDAVRSAVNEYCDAVVLRWSRSEIKRRRPRIHITVRTPRPVMNIHDRVQMQVAHAIAMDLRDAVLEPVRYVLAPHGWPPDIDVTIAPPAASICVDEPDDGGAEPPLRLLLTYDDRSWGFALSSMDRWVSLGRDDGRPGGGGDAVILLPHHMRAVPRDRVLLIQYWLGEVRWRRSAVPSRYAIRVDRQLLAVGEEIPSRSGGTIEYVGPTGAATRLTYQLTYEDSEP